MINIQFLKRLLFVSLLLACTLANAQIETFRVNFNQVDPNYDATENSSAISRNTDSRLGKLFLFFGGTGSNSSIAYDALRREAAGLGFDCINLSYPNNVAAASLSSSTDPDVFAKYREEICFGTPQSDEVVVDSFNSIFTRTLTLLQYLNDTFPSDGWDTYLAGSNTIDWAKVVVGGHSQGSGHAAYLAKRFAMERVLMFSGPNDYSDAFTRAANWLNTNGFTPAEQHYAYLSLNDEVVDFSKQYENLEALGIRASGDSIHVDLIAPPFDRSRLLYTTQSLGLNHNAPTINSSLNRTVWTYMLTSPIVSSNKSSPNEKEITAFPNPVQDVLFLNSQSDLANATYSLQNAMGQIVLTGNLTIVQEKFIDVSNFASGIYFLRIKGISATIIKK